MELYSTRPWDAHASNEAVGSRPSVGHSTRPVVVNPTQGNAILDEYLHPFKVLATTSKVYVLPGWVFGLKDSQILARNQVQMNATDLGNPFLGQTLPTLDWTVGRLYLKITVSSNVISSCEIVFETEANAVDSATVKWLWIAETKADQLIEQHLKSDVFIPLPNDDWGLISFNSITGTTTGTVNIADGLVMCQEATGIDPLDPAPTKIFTRLAVASVFKPEAAPAFAVSNGDSIYCKVLYSAETYGTPAIKVYQAVDAEYVKDSGTPTDDVDKGHVYIGTISIVASKMTISQKPPGVITAPAFTLPAQITEVEPINYKWFTVTATATPGTFSVYQGVVHTTEDDTAAHSVKVLLPSTNTAVVATDTGWICLVLVLTDISDVKHMCAWSETSGHADNTLDVDASGTDVNSTNMYQKGRQVTLASPHYVWHASPPDVSYIKLAEVINTAGVWEIRQVHDGIITFAPAPHWFGTGGGA